MITLLEIYRTAHCKCDLVRIKVLLALDLAKYSKPIDLDIESVDRPPDSIHKKTGCSG